MRWLRDRTTGEILVLLVAFTVCGYVVTVGTFILVAEIIYNGQANDGLIAAGRNIVDIINTLIGLMAGFLAGRQEILKKKPGAEPDEEA